MTVEGRKSLIGSLGELPQGVEPERDLWPQIEAQIAGRVDAAPAVTAPPRRAATGTGLRWLAAAAMVGCVAVGVWIGHSVWMGGTAAPPLAAATRPGAGTLQTAWVADPRYQREHAELMRSLGDRIAALPPASRVKVMASLTTIREAKHNLEEALGKDPGNALLQELLVNTYQDEMRVLTDVREASDAGKGI
ncbi:MAG TPA: hypothetical protein VGR80_03615 [Steroidobacteraceae bacterium]|nr:hypothetical protein [Gammaproteobacteria bacterium]HEV2285109.1 hypothetical protein [Steroidobacteraceae bacterium]